MRPFRPVVLAVGVVTSLGVALPAAAAPRATGADIGSVRALSLHVAGFVGASP